MTSLNRSFSKARPLNVSHESRVGAIPALRLRCRCSVLAAALIPMGFSVAASQAKADQIVNFGFDNYTAPTAATTSISGIAADTGSSAATSFASSVHASASTFSTPAGDGPPTSPSSTTSKSLSANNYAVGDYFQFDVPLTTLVPGSITFSQVSSGTGPSNFLFQYSVDGTNFTSLAVTNGTGTTSTASAGYTVVSSVSFSAAAVKTGTAANFAVALTAPDVAAKLSTATALTLRIVDNSTVSANGGTVAATGTGRIDNFDVESVVAAPEPTSLVLLSGASLAFGTRRRRRSTR